MHNPADIKVFDETGKLNTIVPLKQIRPIREKFDTMESKLFKKRLNQLNRPQKEIDLENKLAKFEDAKIRNEMEYKNKFQEEQERDRQIKDERRKIELNKLQRNITFMEDWQAKGIAEWKKNQQRKHEREKKDTEFELMTTMKAKTKAVGAEMDERREVLGGIDDFEANAGKLGVIIEHDPEETNKVEVEKTTFSMSTTLMKMKEKPLQTESSRKERDKR